MAIEIPAVCACGSAQLRVLDGYAPNITECGGTHPQGFDYVRIVNRWKECSNCGKRIIVKTYIQPPKEKLPTVVNSDSAGIAEETDSV